MPRQRMVKPEFFDSESLALCSIEARLAFIGLWVMSDDFGNQKAQLSRLKTRIFPYDRMGDRTFLGMLCELEEVGCIKGYEIDGDKYITIPNFAIYQTVNRPSKSSIPEPPKGTVKARRTKVVREWANGTGTLTQYSLNAHSLNESSCTTHPERKKEGKKEVVVSQQQLPKEESASDGADAQGAPPSALKCPTCDATLRSTNSHKPSGERLFRCDLCGTEVWR